VLFIALFAALPVSADPPVKTEAPWIEELFVADCGDFQVYDHIDGTSIGTMYFASDGVTPLRSIVIERGTDNLYTTAAPDVIVLSGKFDYQIHWEAYTYEPFVLLGRWTGTVWHIKSPDGGQLYRESGQSVALVNAETYEFTSLKLVGLMNLDDDKLCEAMK